MAVSPLAVETALFSQEKPENKALDNILTETANHSVPSEVTPKIRLQNQVMLVALSAYYRPILSNQISQDFFS